ncbi:hypothetical protein P3S67_027558 [Capsicum chacoense]
MANNIFPNNINDAPKCRICLEKVIDKAGRSITKLSCEHLFHTDCIGSEFNARGIMICPHCQVVEEKGDWVRFSNFGVEEETNEKGKYCEEQLITPEEELELPATIKMYDGNTSNMRNEMETEDPWADRVVLMDRMMKLIRQQKECIQYLCKQLHIPSPPPISPKMVDHKQIFFSGSNSEPDPMSHRVSTSHEQTHTIPFVELTELTCTSLGRDGHPLS